MPWQSSPWCPVKQEQGKKTTDMQSVAAVKRRCRSHKGAGRSGAGGGAWSCPGTFSWTAETRQEQVQGTGSGAWARERLWAWHGHWAFPPLTLRLSSALWKALHLDGTRLPVWRDLAVGCGIQQGRGLLTGAGGLRVPVEALGVSDSQALGGDLSWAPDSQHSRPRCRQQVMTQNCAGQVLAPRLPGTTRQAAASPADGDLARPRQQDQREGAQSRRKTSQTKADFWKPDAGEWMI